MTATVDKAAGSDAGHTGIGRVARVIGPVVDVEFGVDDLPEIYNALEVDIDLSGEDEDVEGLHKHTLTLEVSQHIGDNLIRAISMQPTDGLVVARRVRDTGGPDQRAGRRRHQGACFQRARQGSRRARRLAEDHRALAYHRPSPPFDQLESKTEMFETGIKVIDLLTPYVRGGRSDCSAVRCRQDRLDPGDDHPRREELRRCVGVSQVSASAPVKVTTSSLK